MWSFDQLIQPTDYCQPTMGTVLGPLFNEHLLSTYCVNICDTGKE